MRNPIGAGIAGTFGRAELPRPTAALSARIDVIDALEQVGARRSFTREEEIYAEGDRSDTWYRVTSGTVRLCRLMVDGRRHVAEFCFTGDCFGLDLGDDRLLSAEAVSDVTVTRFSRAFTDRLIDQRPELSRSLCHITMRNLAHAQNRMLLLGRMTASERVATFLLELADRRDVRHTLDVPMSRNDIADYLGLTVETVCRVLSAFKRENMIAIPSPHRIEFLDRAALEVVSEA